MRNHAYGVQKTNRQKFVALSSLVEGLNEIGHNLTCSKINVLLTIRFLRAIQCAAATRRLITLPELCYVKVQ